MTKKILLIEDDPLMSELYQNILVLENFEVILAKDGESGLVKAKSEHPDLILLDIMMPKIDGFEVLKTLKGATDTKGIPVIMLTNLQEQGNAEVSFESGASEYIVKSDHDPDDLIKIIKAILTKK